MLGFRYSTARIRTPGAFQQEHSASSATPGPTVSRSSGPDRLPLRGSRCGRYRNSTISTLVPSQVLGIAFEGRTNGDL